MAGLECQLIALDGDDGQAAAVDRDAVAELGMGCYFSGSDDELHAGRFRDNGRDFGKELYEACKHVGEQ